VYVIAFGNPVAAGSVTASSVPTVAFSVPVAGENVGAVGVPLVDSSPVCGVPGRPSLAPLGLSVQEYGSPLSCPVSV
jgi:hypothetical protein